MTTDIELDFSEPWLVLAGLAGYYEASDEEASDEIAKALRQGAKVLKDLSQYGTVTRYANITR